MHYLRGHVILMCDAACIDELLGWEMLISGWVHKQAAGCCLSTGIWIGRLAIAEEADCSGGYE